MRVSGLAFLLCAIVLPVQASEGQMIPGLDPAGRAPERADIIRVAQNGSLYETMSKDELKALQRALARLGFYRGDIDGAFGQGSRAAASRFQARIGARGTGLLTEAEIETLLAAAQKAEAENPTPKPVTFGIAGMPIRDGAVVIGSGTNSTLGGVLGDGDYINYERALDRFGRLLILASDPGLLDEPEHTALFVPLLDIEDVSPFISESDVRRVHSSGHYYQTGPDWRGGNQFAQEDSRMAFLAKFRDRLLAQTPSFPIRIEIARRIGYGRYADGELAIEISSTPVFPYYSRFGLEAPEPFRQPTTWALDAADARRVIETPLSLEFDFPLTLTQAVISGARRDGNGTVLDITAQGISVYSSVLMQEKVGEIPLPGSARKSPVETPYAIKGPFPLDPFYLRMLLARERPDFADTAFFRQQTFAMRRAAEQNVKKTERVPPFDWPALISPSLVGSQADPTDDDIMDLDEWFTVVKGRLEDTAMLNGLCWYEDDVCQLHDKRPDGSAQLLLGNLVETAIGKWDYGWNGLPEGASQVAQQTYPGNSGLLAFGAGEDIGGMIVLKAHPAWYGIALPEGTISDAALEVRVVRQRILGTQSGAGFFTVEIEPVALHYQSEGEWRELAIDAPAEEAAAESPSGYDILGVRLGMPLAEAETIIAATFSGRDMQQFEAINEANLRDGDPALAHSVAFRSPPLELPPEVYDGDYGIGTEAGEEAIKLYFDASKPDRPIVAIGRVVRFAGNLNSNAEEKAAGQPVLDGLVRKYGEPARTAELHDQYTATVWAAEETARVRVASGAEDCDIDTLFARTDENIRRVRSGLITVPCGEVLNAWFQNGRLSLFLADTTDILALQKAYAEGVPAAEPSAPAIQF